jgi:hypothetical protein
MILYHHTSIDALIKADPDNAPMGDAPAEYDWTWSSDLKPGPDSMDGWTFRNFNPPPAAWFTTNPTSDGIFPSKFYVRITVAIASNSRRLVHWGSYLRKHGAEPCTSRFTEAMLATTETFYCYFGTVDQSCIRAIEVMDCAVRPPPDFSRGKPPHARSAGKADTRQTSLRQEGHAR